MVEPVSRPWPIDRVDTRDETSAATGEPARPDGLEDGLKEVHSRIDEGQQVVAWVRPPHGAGDDRLEDALAERLAATRRVVQVSGALLDPAQLATEIAGCLARPLRRHGTEAGRPAPNMPIVLLIASAEGVLPETARWLDRLVQSCTPAVQLVMIGRSRRLLRAAIATALSRALWVPSEPAPPVHSAAPKLPPAAELAITVEPTRPSLAAVPTARPARPPPAEAPAPVANLRVAESIEARIERRDRRMAEPESRKSGATREQKARANARARTARWPIRATLALLFAVAITLTDQQAIAPRPAEPTRAAISPGVGLENARDATSREIAAPPRTSSPTDARAAEPEDAGSTGRDEVVFDPSTGLLRLELRAMPLRRALLLIGWQSGIRFDTELALAEPVSVTATVTPLMEALRSLLSGYRALIMTQDASGRSEPRTVWILAPQRGPAEINRAVEVLVGSDDPIVREEAARRLLERGRTAAALEVLERLALADARDDDEAAFLSSKRDGIRSALCRAWGNSIVGPEAGALDCDAWSRTDPAQ